MTREAVDGMLRPEYREIVLGQEKIRVTKCDQDLVDELIALGREHENKDGIRQTVGGKTMCANDFYEGNSTLIMIK